MPSTNKCKRMKPEREYFVILNKKISIMVKSFKNQIYKYENLLDFYSLKVERVASRTIFHPKKKCTR